MGLTMRGAQFEIRIDGTPRTYRDRKDFAMEAARRQYGRSRRARSSLDSAYAASDTCG